MIGGRYPGLFDRYIPYVMVKRLLILFLFCSTSAFSQSVVDRLVDSLANAKNTEEKVRQSLKIAQELKDTDWNRSLYYLNNASALAEKAGMEKELADVYTLMADVYYDKDALDVSLYYYLNAYHFYKMQNDSRDKLVIENNLGVVYTRLRENQKALSHFQEVYRIANDLNDTIFILNALNNIGTIFLYSDTDTSYRIFRRALEITKDISDNKASVYVYSNLARNYAIQNKPDSALLLFRKALTVVEQDSTISKNDIWVYKAMGQFYFDLQEYDSTITYINRMDKIVDEKYSFDYQDNIRLLYRSYLMKRDYQKASQYFQVYEEISDSLNITEKLTNAERIILEQEFTAHQKERELEESQQRFVYLIIGLSLVILLLVLLLLIIYYKNKLSRSRLQQDLMISREKELNLDIELKNRELMSKALLEINRNEVVQTVLDDLNQVKKGALRSETKSAIDYVARKLEGHDREHMWDEFQMSFEKVSSSFFNRLSEKHPELTLREKRLCALLNLGLTTKEIADINGQSLKSVENARTRLRKKLGLTNIDSNLSAYLSEFN